jgi:hypothetical protein
MKQDGTPENPDQKKAGVSEGHSTILAEMKERFRISGTAEGDSRKEALNDLNFLRGDQWPEDQKRKREAEGRPCLTVNKIPTFLQQVTNDQRQNRASMKVSAVGMDASTKTAELIQGMIRHIEYDSSADAAYDTAVNSAAAIGFGYFRFITEYEDPESFDQVIRIKRIRNAFTVSIDPSSAEADGSDMQWALITEKMTRDEFKAKYPDAEITQQGFDTYAVGDAHIQDWVWEQMVRVAEYYKIKFTPGTVYKLGDGSVTWEKPPAGVNVVATRKSVRRQVMWYLCTPYEVLEETEIMSKWIPVFPCYGTEIDIDGKVFRAGLIRNAKDPAMMYNFWMTSATEEVSLRPKTPYIGAEGQFEGHEKKWNQANNRSFPFLEYKPIEINGQLAPPPQRQAMADIPNGMLMMANHASDNVKQTTGLFDSSLGAAGNATSGKQELAQQKQGNVANYHYMDNFTRTLRHAGKVLLDMIPAYYDAPRIVRSRGEDGTTVAVPVNQPVSTDEVKPGANPQPVSPQAADPLALATTFMHDLSVRQYDIAVTSGPSYATMRAEAADAMVQFGQSWPKLMDVAGDKVVKAMNWPGAEEIAERIARTIPANIKDDPQNGQSSIPPEAQQQIAELQQKLQEAQQEADKNNAAIERERIKSTAQVEVAHIVSESRKDTAELTGLVKLLIAKMQPPPGLTQDVAQDWSNGAATPSADPSPVAPGAPGQEPAAPPAQPEPMNTPPSLLGGN